MALYKRKPTTVDAEQFDNPDKPPRGVKFSDSLGHYVTTIQGRHVCVSIGEWIIREADGDHFYPIADETFSELYSRE